MVESGAPLDHAVPEGEEQSPVELAIELHAG
jgi:hypothetical protein